MKKLMISAVMVFSFSCLAAEPDHLSTCTQLAALGKQVMQARQNGVAMADMVKLAHESDPVLRPMFLEMTKMAYDHPAYHTERMKARAIGEFHDLNFKLCYSQVKAD